MSACERFPGEDARRGWDAVIRWANFKKVSGSARVPACNFRRPSGKPGSAGRRTAHARRRETRMLPRIRTELELETSVAPRDVLPRSSSPCSFFA